MKLSSVAIVWLAQSMMAFGQSVKPPFPEQGCNCSDGLTACYECFANNPPVGYSCSTTCNVQCVDLINDPKNCGFCGNVVSVTEIRPSPHPQIPSLQEFPSANERAPCSHAISVPAGNAGIVNASIRAMETSAEMFFSSAPVTSAIASQTPKV